MAHELDTRENGVAAMFSVRETPWHNEGTLLVDAPSLDEGMKLGGLDFDVALRPIEAVCEVREGETFNKPIEGFRAVVRTDRQATLGVVGPSYHALQNVDAFRVLEPLLDSGVAELETGGTLREGRDVWMMVRFNISDPKVQDVFGSEIVPFGLISNNHSGARKVTLQETPIRVVCANTLGMALGQRGQKAITVRHTTNVKSRTIEAAQELFADFSGRYRVIAEQYEKMKQATMTTESFEAAVLDLIATLPEAPKGEQKNNIATAAYERAKERAEAKRSRLIFLRDNGIGHVGDGSAWEAYQAVTQSIDHDVDLWKVSGESRVAALFDGALGKTKQSALEAIYATTAGKK